jgi:hypothetical protein
MDNRNTPGNAPPEVATDATTRPGVSTAALQGGETLLFLAPVPQTGHFVLTCSEPGLASGPIRAYVNGIPLGSVTVTGPVARGDRILVPCTTFPATQLPSKVRFADTGTRRDIAPPLELMSPAQVEAIVGTGTLEEVSLEIANGVIRGQGVNRVNGLATPTLIGRVNRHTLREIRFVRGRSGDDGAVSFSFTLPIEPGDFGDAGARYEILQLPTMAVVGAIGFARQDAEALAATVAQLDKSVTDIGRRLNFELTRAAERADRSALDQREMLDSLVEYLVSFVYDNVHSRARAVAIDPQGAEAQALNAGQAAGTLEALRTILKSSTAQTVIDHLDYAVVMPDSPFMADGWSWVEQDSKGFNFRWMGLGAVAFNPHPERPVVKIVVAIGTSYRHRAPEISAMFDADIADSELVASPNGPPYSLSIYPKNKRACSVNVVRLLSTAAGRPAEEEGTVDDRILSVAVSSIVFYYG